MTGFVRRHSLMAASLGMGLWVFIAWRVAGMPSPGFLGRLVPAAWILTGVLAGRTPRGPRFSILFTAFTVSAWLWQLWEPAWYIAAAAAVAGVISAGFSIAARDGGVIRAVLPVLLLSAAVAEVNSDEVRFAEISCRVTGIRCGEWSEGSLRAGDIGAGVSHHTELFPLIISPGLLAGSEGLRIVPVIIAASAIVMLASAAGPVPAVLAALLYPGFSTLGLAYTGWTAVLLFLAALRFRRSKYGWAARWAAALLLVLLKMRYAPLAAGLIASEYLLPGRITRRKLLLPAALAAAGLCFLAVDRYLFEGGIFWVRYGNVEALKMLWINLFHRPAQTLAHLGWSLFDPEAGLFFRAPWTIAALTGLPLLHRRDPELLVRLAVPSVLYWLTLVLWLGSGWHGLPAPAGRMFLPLVPLFAAGIGELWRKPGPGVLLGFSAAVSALVLVHPPARANFADGTDTLLALLEGAGGFSMVRSSPFNLLIPLAMAVGMWVMIRGNGSRGGPAIIIMLFAAFFTGLAPRIADAEDLDGRTVQGAPLYPGDPDPLIRSFWFTGGERLLEMSSPSHSLTLAGAGDSHLLLLEVSSAGGELLVGDSLLCVETPKVTIPAEYLFAGRRQAELPERPENRRTQEFLIPVDTRGDSLLITWAGGEPVYIDRVGFLR